MLTWLLAVGFGVSAGVGLWLLDRWFATRAPGAGSPLATPATTPADPAEESVVDIRDPIEVPAPGVGPGPEASGHGEATVAALANGHEGRTRRPSTRGTLVVRPDRPAAGTVAPAAASAPAHPDAHELLSWCTQGAPGGTDLGGWAALLESVAPLRVPQRYVGSYRRTISAAGAVAERLPSDARPVAADLLVHLASAHATSLVDFRHSMAVAERVDPLLRDASGVVARLVGICLEHPHSPPRHPAGAFGLPYALDVVAASGAPSLTDDDVRTLRAAMASLADGRAVLTAFAPRLRRRDRKLVDDLLREPASVLPRRFAPDRARPDGRG